MDSSGCLALLYPRDLSPAWPSVAYKLPSLRRQTIKLAKQNNKYHFLAYFCLFFAGVYNWVGLNMLDFDRFCW